MEQRSKPPVSVVIVTKNEAHNLPRCLKALEGFDDVMVVDSQSHDGTPEIARSFGVRVHDFVWNGAYPKKRQWVLDHIPLKHDYVFFVDADEEITPALYDEISNLPWDCAGYFVKGRYVVDGQILQHGFCNNKLCLFNRHKIEFPVVDDLDIPGMGEIEGHYQPVFKSGVGGAYLGNINNPLLHHAFEHKDRYDARHESYAEWEKGMKARKAYPQDPVLFRRLMKKIFNAVPKPFAAFAHSYILKLGFLDGRQGLDLALRRYNYYNRI